MSQSRRKFLSRAVALGSVASLAPYGPSLLAAPALLAAGPIDPVVVKEFVTVAHNDLDRLKAILDEHPKILNAAWDWGDGDFETALGAAGHMGLRETAEYLLEKGARADIFVLTMLGETAIVKSTLERYPKLLNATGPHGFTLLHHAKKGGEPAQELFDYLSGQGLTETFIKMYNKG